jgi:ATP-dependent Clp protease ATP-binding subunit ClpC
VDFRNTVIIMTSNLGTEFARKGGPLGFVPHNEPELVADHKNIERAIRETFRPEFLNRIDEVIIFSPLSPEQVQRMVDLQMRGITERLGEQGLVVELTDNARSFLARQGFDPQFGARPLRRALQRYIENILSSMILKGEARRGDMVVIDEVDMQLVFEWHENASTDYLNLRQDQDQMM